jgi:hypothetical protein
VPARDSACDPFRNPSAATWRSPCPYGRARQSNRAPREGLWCSLGWENRRIARRSALPHQRSALGLPIRSLAFEVTSCVSDPVCKTNRGTEGWPRLQGRRFRRRCDLKTSCVFHAIHSSPRPLASIVISAHLPCGRRGHSYGRIVATDPADHRRAHQPTSDATIASSWTRRYIVAPPEIGLRPTTGNTAGRIRTGRDSSRTGRDTRRTGRETGRRTTCHRGRRSRCGDAPFRQSGASARRSGTSCLRSRRR